MSVADDCDRMTPAIRALGAANMPQARTLPFLIVTDAEGRWVAGRSGFTTAEQLMSLLRGALA